MTESTVQVIISDEASFKRKKEALLAGGADRCQVIADFDRTLTATFVGDGAYGMSSHGIVENSPALSAGYKAKMRELFDFYYPIEKDMAYPQDQKILRMVEWWEKAHAALISERVPYSVVKEACQNAVVAFRKGVPQLFETCDTHKIPILIFSAGLGDVISELVQQKISNGKQYDSVHIISNMINADEEGIISGFKGSLIHVFNKNEHAVADDHVGWWNTVAGRNNVILLGDSPGDVSMADGVPNVNVVLKIGFLNEQVQAKLDIYMTMFDVIITNDGPMDYIIDLVNQILRA